MKIEIKHNDNNVNKKSKKKKHVHFISFQLHVHFNGKTRIVKKPQRINQVHRGGLRVFCDS